MSNYPKIKFSHSSLSCILTNPMLYNLTHEHGILPRITPQALSIGSAVHYGIEHNSADLVKYYEEIKDFKDKTKIDSERILAEEMVSAYLNNKEKIFNEILGDEELVEEIHELKLEANLPSVINGFNQFLGIIDLLLVTKNGYVIVDYKTSSQVPDWNQYLDQLYRYVFLVQNNFDKPILKLAIINLVKSNVNKKTNEPDTMYRRRLKAEYLTNTLITSHIFNKNSLDEDKMKQYIENLAIQCDNATLIVALGRDKNIWYTNFEDLNKYGGSPYKYLINNSSAYSLFRIRDKYYDVERDEILDWRPMKKVDSLALSDRHLLQFSRYDLVKPILEQVVLPMYNNNVNLLYNDTEKVIELFNKEYKNIDVDLIKNYILIFTVEKLTE